MMRVVAFTSSTFAIPRFSFPAGLAALAQTKGQNRMIASASAKVSAVSLSAIAIPPGGGGLLLEPRLPGLASRLGARFLDKPITFGGKVIAVRHRDVV